MLDVTWLFLGGGLAISLLAAAIVETLARRRAYALTERTRELEQALDEVGETRTFLDRLLTAGPVLMLRLTMPDLRISYVSPNIERLSGVTEQQALGPGDPLGKIHLDDLPAFGAALGRFEDGSSAREVIEYRVDPGDGSSLWRSGVFVPETDESDGRVVAVLAYIVDVDDRRRAEDALGKAREAAAVANHAKSDFLSRMSHELRTPLNAVLGFGQLLELDELSAEQRDSVEHILSAGRHLLGLIDEVLDISRVESGELRLSLEPVSLHEVVGKAVGMLTPLATARMVRIDGLVAGSEEHVRADRQRLKQVVVNLLANAVKYNRKGGEVSVVCEAVSDGRVRLVVADTGIGIAEHDLARLFLPFERLGAEKSDVEGTGLGLALSKQLVEAMGGEIGATSQTGVGSSFWVELPLADAPGGQEEESLPPAVALAPLSARARTVLYVEDNLSNVKLVERIVASRPEVTLIVAMQGGIALELARSHQPSLVLLDLHLPDVSGEEVLQRLRADPRTSATPVVVLSADATPGQVQRLLANGATDYLTKPFDIPRLLAVIDGTGSTEQPTAAP